MRGPTPGASGWPGHRTRTPLRRPVAAQQLLGQARPRAHNPTAAPQLAPLLPTPTSQGACGTVILSDCTSLQPCWGAGKAQLPPWDSVSW